MMGTLRLTLGEYSSDTYERSVVSVRGGAAGGTVVRPKRIPLPPYGGGKDRTCAKCDGTAVVVVVLGEVVFENMAVAE